MKKHIKNINKKSQKNNLLLNNIKNCLWNKIKFMSAKIKITVF